MSSTSSDGKSSKSNSSGSSIGSLNLRKIHDKAYLKEQSTQTFDQGYRYVRRGNYEKARYKFRTALKARILLHGNAQHISIAPIHEMLGHIELKLEHLNESVVHYKEALEILNADKQVETNEGRSENNGIEEDEGYKDTLKIIARIEKSLYIGYVSALERGVEEGNTTGKSTGKKRTNPISEATKEQEFEEVEVPLDRATDRSLVLLDAINEVVDEDQNDVGEKESPFLAIYNFLCFRSCGVKDQDKGKKVIKYPYRIQY